LTVTAHDRAVRAIRSRKQFTILEIASEAGIDKSRATLIVTTLTRKGYLRKVTKSRPARGHLGYARYELIKTIPGRAPVARTRIWRSMRVMRRFTIADLAATAEAGLQNTHTYVVDLVNGGYIRKLKMEVPKRGVEGRAIFALIKDTGPFAPSYRKATREIIDPNVAGAGAGGSGCEKRNGLRG
jgi:hypothetical protein